MMKMVLPSGLKIIDISQDVLSCEVYPGDPVPQGDKIKSMEQGELYNLSVLSMCAHNGTHIDAPSHFLRYGETVGNGRGWQGICIIRCQTGWEMR